MGENNTPTALKGCGVKMSEKNTYTRLEHYLQYGHTAQSMCIVENDVHIGYFKFLSQK